MTATNMKTERMLIAIPKTLKYGLIPYPMRNRMRPMTKVNAYRAIIFIFSAVSRKVAATSMSVKLTTNCSKVLARTFFSSWTICSLPPKGSMAAVKNHLFPTFAMKNNRIKTMGKAQRMV